MNLHSRLSANINHQKYVHRQWTGEKYKKYRSITLPQQKEKDRSHYLHLYTNKTRRTFHTLLDLQATLSLA